VGRPSRRATDFSKPEVGDLSGSITVTGSTTYTGYENAPPNTSTSDTTTLALADITNGMGGDAQPARSSESILEEYRDRSEQVARLQDALASETNPDVRDYYQLQIDTHNNILTTLTTEALAAGITQAELNQTTTQAQTTAANNPIETLSIADLGPDDDSAAPGYFHFLFNPSDMDDDLETGFYVAAGTAAAAGAGIAAVTYGPALMAASADITLPTLALVPGGMTIGQGGMLVATGGGLAVGTTTVTVTGAQTAAAAGLLGSALFMSRKGDLKQVDEVARQMGIKDRNGFGRYVEEAKELDGRGGRDNFSFKELLELASEFLEFFGAG
jgi:hypothetical protein